METSQEYLKVGDKVIFGRTSGEKTLGEIVKCNTVKLKIKQLEDRGTHRIGTIWTVPPSLVTRVANGQAVAPQTATVVPAKPATMGYVQGDAAQVQWNRWAVGWDLKPEWFGKVFTAKGSAYRVTGLHTNRPKFPVDCVRVSDGKLFKFTVRAVVSCLGVTVQNAALPASENPVPGKRTEAQVMQDILGCYSQLSPENLSWDGERSSAEIAKAAKSLNAQLQGLYNEIGRTVSESEAYRFSR